MRVNNSVTPLRTPPPKANRMHPEKDTALRWRGVPASSVVDGGGGLLLVPRHFMYDNTGKQLDSSLVASLLARMSLLEKQVQDLRSGAPVEKSDRPMTPAKAKEQSKAHIAVSVPGNEAEVLTISDVTPVAKAETVLLLPAPSKMTLVPPLQTVAANEEIVIAPNVALLPAAKAEVAEDVYTTWLSKQFGWTEEEMFHILDGVYQKRNESALKVHGMTYNDIRLKRAIAKHHMVVLGLDAYCASEDTKYIEWLAQSHQAKPTQLSVRAFLQKYLKQEHRAYRRGMAFTPEAFRVREARRNTVRKHDILSRLEGAKFGQAVKFATVDALAHDPVVPRTSAAQLSALGMAVRDTADRLRRAVGWAIPDRGAEVRARAEEEGTVYQAFKGWFSERVTPSDGGPDLPNPANLVIADLLKNELDQVPIRELVRRYRQAGISH